MFWKTKSSKEIYKNKWIKLTEDKVETNLGEKLIYSIVHKKPFALIIPWDGKRFVLVRPYRYSVSQFSWEFPAGHFQGGGIRKTATAELEEETGLIAKRMQKVGIFHPANGFLDQECHVFLATDLIKGAQNRGLGEKGMRVKRVTTNELKRMIKDGKVKDGPTLAAFALLETEHLIKGLG